MIVRSLGAMESDVLEDLILRVEDLEYQLSLIMTLLLNEETNGEPMPDVPEEP